MPLSTQERVTEAFLEATRQSLARSLRTGEDWGRYKIILTETNARLKAEDADHALNFQKRIAEAKEIILREEHSVRLDQPLPPGAAKFSDRDLLDKKADARVRQDHDRRIAAIKGDELDQYRSLTKEIRQRDTGKPEQSTHHSRTVTRSGPTQN